MISSDELKLLECVGTDARTLAQIARRAGRNEWILSDRLAARLDHMVGRGILIRSEDGSYRIAGGFRQFLLGLAG